jgi:DNA-binding NarL/FixJ family response regulator
MISVLMSEDDKLLCQLVADILRPHNDLRLIGAAVDGHEALYAIPEYRPDVLLLDLNLPRLSGMTILSRLALLADPPRVLVVSGSDSVETQCEAIREGAMGFVSKSSGLITLPDAIRAVAAGHVWLADEVAARIVSEYQTSARKASSALPPSSGGPRPESGATYLHAAPK